MKRPLPDDWPSHGISIVNNVRARFPNYPIEGIVWAMKRNEYIGGRVLATQLAKSGLSGPQSSGRHPIHRGQRGLSETHGTRPAVRSTRVVRLHCGPGRMPFRRSTGISRRRRVDLSSCRSRRLRDEFKKLIPTTFLLRYYVML